MGSPNVLHSIIYVNNDGDDSGGPAWRGGPDGRLFSKRLQYSNGATGFLAYPIISECPTGDPIQWPQTVFVPQTPEVFTYDADGNLKSDGMWQYSWDAENRLKQMKLQNGVAYIMNQVVTLNFAYDYLGRRIQKKYTLKTWDGGGDGNPTIGPDGAGGQTIMVGGNQLTWSPPNAAETSTSEWRYVYDTGSWLLSASYSTGGLITSGGSAWALDQTFAWGPDLSGTYGGAGGIGGLAVEHDYANGWAGDGGGGDWPMFPTFDGNGNVTGLYTREQSSTVSLRQVAAYQYGPFGETRSITGDQGQRNPMRFSTKFTDAETGLVYFGRRWLFPTEGRWITTDPIEERGGLNTLSFIHNDPICSIDPDGRKRLIFAFGGLGEGTLTGPNWAHVATIDWKNAIATSPLSKDEYEYKVYFHTQWHSAVSEALRLAQQPDANEGCQYDTIIAIGFSWGGDAALKFAKGLADQHVLINLGYTVDTVPKNLVGSLVAPGTVRWKNRYQTFARSPLGAIGHAVQNAINKEFSPDAVRPFVSQPTPGAPLELNERNLIRNYGIDEGHDLITLWDANIDNGVSGAHVAIGLLHSTLSELVNEVSNTPKARSSYDR